jgi:hypothetical protein
LPLSVYFLVRCSSPIFVCSSPPTFQFFQANYSPFLSFYLPSTAYRSFLDTMLLSYVVESRDSLDAID